ncbi:hypothetical protein HPB48_015847 [Haemaphysalis longicornis]|uniref:Transposase Helix-turn-helix domain-containing protein n=1 Tax=Haemaphysalis longicornis TaxID=44386 RepID=A0A9J6H6C6_HAELO|nr:hypothetical protein HPB48_015847 [Haemaphysalis longicornis]
MTKASFDQILGLVYYRILHAPTHRRPIYPAERLAVTLRFLATGGSMQEIAFNFRIHPSTVSGILKETLPALWDCLAPTVLRTPTAAEWAEIENEFSSKWNFPPKGEYTPRTYALNMFPEDDHPRRSPMEKAAENSTR